MQLKDGDMYINNKFQHVVALKKEEPGDKWYLYGINDMATFCTVSTSEYSMIKELKRRFTKVESLNTDFKFQVE